MRIDEPWQERAAGKIDELLVSPVLSPDSAPSSPTASTLPRLTAMAEEIGSPGSGRTVPAPQNEVRAFVRRESGDGPDSCERGGRGDRIGHKCAPGVPPADLPSKPAIPPRWNSSRRNSWLQHPRHTEPPEHGSARYDVIVSRFAARINGPRQR